MMKSLKMNMLLIMLIMIIPLGSMAQSGDSGEITVPLSSPGKRGKLKVDIKRGSITVKGTNRSDILVKYVSEVKNSSGSKSKEGLKRISAGTIDLEVREEDNYVRVDSDSHNKGVSLDIEVPKDFDLHVETYNNGFIYVSDVSGEVVADNYNGKITLLNISGAAVADTYNGQIKVTFDQVKAGVPMAFTNYNGNVDITFPASVKASLKMKTQREVYTGFDIDLKNQQVESRRREGSYRVKIGEWVVGNINGGGAEIMMKSYNGDIYVRKK
ncbi:MAG: hypothetical protein AAFX87_21950 [Bacteroidota bacterium]